MDTSGIALETKRSPCLSVIVLTYNEEENLPDCLDSCKRLDCKLFVVDSGSCDRTIEVAKDYGASIFSHPFETHAKQWLWAINTLPITTDWVLGLDADQRVTPELAQEIREKLRERSTEHRAWSTEQEGEVAGFYIKRRQIFRGRWIRYGGYYPKYLLKLFRRDRVRVDPNDLMDHHFYVDGPTANLRSDLIEANTKEDDISFWIDKHNGYATLVAREELHRREKMRHNFLQPSFVGNPDQRTLSLKRLWWRLPLFVRPFLYFFYRYFLRLGFLDGKEGFIFHLLQGFWFRLLVDIKLDELQAGRRGLRVRSEE